MFYTKLTTAQLFQSTLNSSVVSWYSIQYVQFLIRLCVNLVHIAPFPSTAYFLNLPV